MRDPVARRRLALFTLLYASEGAPIGFIWWALPTVLRAEALAVERITGLTALLVLPWTFKFLWAPVVDRLRTPRWNHRAWIASAQVAMAACLVPLIWIDPVSGFGTWAVLLTAHAVAAATQDVAIDAFAISMVAPGRRGFLNGAMQAGMLVGRSLFGGGALLLLGWLGYSGVVAALVAWILAALVALAVIDVGEVPLPASGEPAGAFARDLRRAAARPVTWWGMAFAVTGAAAFEAAGQLAGPYLVDRGAATSAIGVFFGLVVVTATLTGGLVGGRLADRWGRLQACAAFLVVVALAVGALGLAEQLGVASAPVRWTLLTAMYAGVGLFTAASYALFMDLTDPRIGGTQFSAYMSGTNACESWAAWAGGRLTAASGYSTAFLAMSAASVLALPLLAAIGRLTRAPARRTSPPR